MTFREFVRGLDDRRRTLTVLDRTKPDPIYTLLQNVFESPSVTVREDTTDHGAMTDVVVLQKDGEPAAASPLSAVEDTVLLVNSDIYTTGARPIEAVDTPDVVAQLDDTRMFAEGYPSVRKQKMLLVEVSRYIEHRAWQVGDGRLHSGFQRLSRIDDESGTRQVYERLADTDVDVNVYGVPDWEPDVDVRAHGEYTDDLRLSWFVVYRSPRDDGADVALVAFKPDPRTNEWEAFWTHDADRVDRVAEYVVGRYAEGPVEA